MPERQQERGRAAVVLATPVAGADPEDRLAGLPLVLRTVLTLQKAGVATVHLAAGPREQSALALLRADKRVRLELCAASGATRAAALSEILEGTTTPLLVAMHDAVADPSLYRALLEVDVDGGAVLSPGAGEPIDQLPFVAGSALREALDGRGHDEELPEVMARLDREGAVDRVKSEAWAISVRSPAGQREAFRELFEACRKPVDGVVARHLNRHISIFVSKLLVDTRLTPNLVSVFTFAIGVAAAASCAAGTYTSLLAGALLFQLNSILDGVDGELARVRFEHSKLGAWIDTISDDLCNVLFYGGVAIAAWSMPGHGPMLALAGAIAVGSGLLTMVLYYAELIRRGSGDFYALGLGQSPAQESLISKAVALVSLFLKKDFFIFAFVIAALFGVLPYALPVAMAGTLITMATGVVLNARWLARRTRRRQER